MSLDPRAFKDLSRFLAPAAGGPVADRALAGNLITPEQWDECVREQDRTGRPLDQILVERGYLKPEEAKGLRQAPLPPEVAEALADPLRQVRHYVLVSILGTGGMSEVWKAWDRSLSRWVAIKLMRSDLGHPTERLEREGRIAGGLSHPNIVSIFERGKHNGRPFLVMPFVEGTPPEAPLPPPEAARLAREIALALGHVHKRGVIHRDVKPGNILVEAGGRVLLADFGLAIPNGSPSSGWSVSGTPEYASPEQIRGEPLDPRTDVYSLGVTLLHLLTGQVPFAGRDTDEIHERVLNGQPPALNAVPPALASVVRKAMARNPAERYASMEEFERALRAFSEGGRWRAILKPMPLMAIVLAGLVSSGITLGLLSLVTRESVEVEVLQAMRDGHRELALAENLLGDPQAKPREIVLAGARALPYFNLAAQLGGPRHPEAAVGQGRCYELMGQEARAEDFYAKAKGIPEGRAGLARVGFRRHLEQRVKLDWKKWAAEGLGGATPGEFSEVFRMYFEGRWGGCLEAAGRQPPEPHVLAAAALSAAELGKWDLAFLKIGHAIRLREADLTLLYLKGLLHARKGEREAAAEVLLQVVARAAPDWPLLSEAEGKLRELRK